MAQSWVGLHSGECKNDYVELVYIVTVKCPAVTHCNVLWATLFTELHYIWSKNTPSHTIPARV